MSRSSGTPTSASSPASGSSSGHSPSVPYVPANLSPPEQAIDTIIHGYSDCLALARNQALDQLKAEKTTAAAAGSRDTVALGVLKRHFRELLDIQLESTVHGDLASQPPNMLAVLNERCTALTGAVVAFERQPVDRKGVPLVLSGQLLRFTSWLKSEVAGLQAKLQPGGSLETLPPGVVAKAMQATEVWYNSRAGGGRGGLRGRGRRRSNQGGSPTSATTPTTPTSGYSGQ